MVRQGSRFAPRAPDAKLPRRVASRLGFKRSLGRVWEGSRGAISSHARGCWVQPRPAPPPAPPRKAKQPPTRTHPQGRVASPSGLGQLLGRCLPPHPASQVHPLLGPHPDTSPAPRQPAGDGGTATPRAFSGEKARGAPGLLYRRECPSLPPGINIATLRARLAGGRDGQRRGCRSGPPSTTTRCPACPPRVGRVARAFPSGAPPLQENFAPSSRPHSPHPIIATGHRCQHSRGGPGGGPRGGLPRQGCPVPTGRWRRGSRAATVPVRCALAGARRVPTLSLSARGSGRTHPISGSARRPLRRGRWRSLCARSLPRHRQLSPGAAPCPRLRGAAAAWRGQALGALGHRPPVRPARALRNPVPQAVPPALPCPPHPPGARPAPPEAASCLAGLGSPTPRGAHLPRRRLQLRSGAGGGSRSCGDTCLAARPRLRNLRPQQLRGASETRIRIRGRECLQRRCSQRRSWLLGVLLVHRRGERKGRV